MNCNLITINFNIDSAYFEEHSVCVDMPSNRVWTYYKNYAEKKKFSGENSEKCVSYAVNTLNYGEIWAVSNIDNKVFPTYSVPNNNEMKSTSKCHPQFKAL